MASGDKFRAVTVGVYVNTGTEGSPTWTKVGGQKSATLSFKMSMDEATTKDSVDNWEEVLPGSRSWGIKCDALKVDSDVGQAALWTAFMSTTPTRVKLRWKDATSALWEGYAYPSNMEEGAPDKGAVTFKVDFTGDGKPTRNPA